MKVPPLPADVNSEARVSAPQNPRAYRSLRSPSEIGGLPRRSIAASTGEQTLISLKKYLELDFPAWGDGNGAVRTTLNTAISCYRSALADMGRSGYRACPTYGAGLQRALSHVEKKLASKVTTGALQEANREVSEQLGKWGEQTAEHLKGKAEEVKGLLMVLACTAESMGERDQRYTSQLQQFTSRLTKVADLEDLTQIRSSLMRTAIELKTCVDRMEQDSQEVIAQLKSKVSTYEDKLKETEELALRDAMTGLPNRLYLERRMEWRVENEQPFSVLFIDLNDFKKVNDQYGHMTGDALLKQFAGELRTNVRPGDQVGRWGGDEFVVLLDCDRAGAAVMIDRLRRWVFGSYTVIIGPEKLKAVVRVRGSIGSAEWVSGESIQSLIERADRGMYREKGGSASAAGYNSGEALSES